MPYLLLVLNILLLVSGQLVWKSAVTHVDAWNFQTFLTLILSPKVILGVFFYGIATVLWLFILSKIPFHIAYPLQSLSYVLGVMFAATLFHEQVGTTQWLGVLTILAGVFLIAK